MSGALDGGIPISYVDLKEWYCRPVEFKKCSCHPVDFKKCQCRMSLSFLCPCCMSLSPKKAHVAVSILGVKGHMSCKAGLPMMPPGG